MAKAMIISHRSEATELLESLQRDGICQILNAEEAMVSKDWPELATAGRRPKDTEQLLSRLAKTISFLKSYVAPAKGLANALAPRTVIDQQMYKKVISDEQLLEILQQAEVCESTIEKLKNQSENIVGILETLSPWQSMETTVEEIGELETTTCLPGLVPSQKFEQVQQQLSELGAAVQQVGTADGKSACLIACLREQANDVQKLLRAVDAEQVSFESMTGTVADLIKEHQGKLNDIAAKLQSQQQLAAELSGNFLELQILFDHHSNLLTRETANAAAPATDSTVIFETWVRRKDYSQLEKTVSQFSASNISIIEPAEGESPPVEIENGRFVEPFEVITRLYGMPRHVEVDPTVFLAPFFALFFGLCLTDAGYGLLLVATLWWVLRKFQGDKKVVWMFFICSAITGVAGAVTGGWFGDAFQTLVPQRYEGLYNGLNLFRTKLMLTDPMENPMVFFRISLGLGYLQIMVGILIAFFSKLSRKDYAAAIFEHATWFVFLNSLVLFGLGKAGILPAGFSTIFGWLAISQAVLIFLFTERKSGLGGRIGGGAFALFSTVFYFGDILSYARLMALGMVTGGLGMAINILVKLLMDLPNPIIGYTLGALLFVVGHLFNIAMSVLSSFVHSLRLQFVEFFPKFFVGGGTIFEPLKKNYKHIMVK